MRGEWLPRGAVGGGLEHGRCRSKETIVTMAEGPVSASGSVGVQIRLLGATTVTVAGIPYDLSGRRAGELVAYLALMAPSPAPPEAIGRALWPAVRPPQQRTNLRHLLFHLRDQYPVIAAALTRDALPDALSFRVPPTVDVTAWISKAPHVSSAEALESWLGAYGPGLGDATPGWMEPWRRQLDDLHRTKTRELAAWYAARHAFADAERTLTRAAPLTEAEGVRLLRVAAMGRQAAGLDAAVSVLGRSAPALPAPLRGEVDRLRVLLSEWGPDPPFVGRAREWERLEHARQRAEAGRPVCVVVQGPPGMGKSALLAEWRRWLDIGNVPLLGLPRRGPAPFQWRQWQADLLAEAPRREGCQGPAWGPPGAGSGAADPPPDRWGRFQALARACATRGPAVLLWDPLPADEQDAWDWLAYLLRSPHRKGLLVCVATPDGPNPVRQRRRLFDALRDTAACEVLSLPPLDSGHARDLVVQLVPRSLDGVESLLRWAAGHPLALVEGARLLAAGGARPAGALSVVIQHRLQALPPPLRRLVTAMAVLGQRMPPPFWRRVGHVTTTGLDLLVRSGLVTMDAAGYAGLAHEAIAAAVRETLAPATHRQWASRLATVLQSGTEETDPAVVAGLYETAQRGVEARAWWQRAAERARHDLRLPQAQRAYERLLVLDGGPNRIAWRIALAGVLADRGQRSEALAHFRTACTEALADANFPRLAQARAGLARQLAVRGDLSTAEALLADNLAYYRQVADRPGVAGTLVQGAELATRHGALETARERAEEARTLGRALPSAQLTAEAEGQLGYVAWEQGRYEDAVRYWRQAEGHAMAAGDALLALRALGDIGVALLDAGHLAPAVEYQWQKATLASQYGLMEDLALALGNLGVAYQDVAQWTDSRHCLTAAIRLALAQDDVRVVTILTNNLAYTHGQAGEVGTAETLWQAAVALAEAIPLPRSTAQFLLHWADLLWERGTPTRIPALLRRAWRVRQASPEWDRARWRALSVRIQSARGILAPEDARRRLLQAWSQWQRPESRALLRYVAWELTHDPDDRRRAIAAVETVWRQHPHHVWQRYGAELTGTRLPLPSLTAPPDWVKPWADPRTTLVDELVAFATRFTAPHVRPVEAGIAASGGPSDLAP